jgi:predicted dehydrogenase
MRERPLGVGMVGFGYWGPNIARNVVERPELRLLGLCELSKERGAEFKRRYPGIPAHRELDALLLDPEVEAVMVATPPRTHFAVVSRALEAGKHVLVEKPLATSSLEAVALAQLAEEHGLVLMPGHTFLYSPPVNKVRDLIRSDVLGEVYFITSSRMNLGKYQADGVITDLAPHDLSILLYWLERPLVQISATAQGIYQDGVHETAFLTMTFAGQTTANVQVSWLAPRKIREMVVVGSKRMIQYQDTASDEAVRVYDRGFEFDEPANFGEYRLTYRSGDIVSPWIEAAEPLSLELQDFARAVRTGERPRSNVDLGVAIVYALEAAEASLRCQGAPMPVGPHPVASPHAGTPNGQGHANGNGNGVRGGNGHAGGNGNGHAGGNGNGRSAGIAGDGAGASEGRWPSHVERNGSSNGSTLDDEHPAILDRI